MSPSLAPITQSVPLVLASASPRRREILALLGIPHRVLPLDVDETPAPGEPPERYVERVTEHKLEAALVAASANEVVLVADTVVTLEGRVLGKPADEGDALGMLELLAGRTHKVITRYALGSVGRGLLVARDVATRVALRQATRAELLAYVRTGESFDKAGAYAVQGLASFLVERIEGSYGAVVGLPACELVADLEALGLLPGYPAEVRGR